MIAEHAFSASPYPLIISLEVHCSLAQQQSLATLLQQGSASSHLILIPALTYPSRGQVALTLTLTI